MRPSKIICCLLCTISILLGVFQVNAQDSLNVTMVGYCNLPSFSDVKVSLNYAYVVDYYSDFRVVNVANPASPYEVGYYHMPGAGYSLAISGSYAYIAIYAGGLLVLNIANPADPVEIGIMIPWIIPRRLLSRAATHTLWIILVVSG